MRYNLVDILGVGAGYQEIFGGQVVRYCDLDGVTLFNEVPSGCTAIIVDANPAQPEWALPDPVVEQSQPEVSRVISKLEYMNRFTDPELAGIYSAAKSIVQVEVWLAKFNAAADVNLDDPRTIGGVHALEAAGLIGEGRANEVLA